MGVPAELREPMDKKLRSLTIEAYASAQTEALLERLAWQVSHTAKRCDPDSIHDLRVEVCHLTNCLRVRTKRAAGSITWPRGRSVQQDLFTRPAVGKEPSGHCRVARSCGSS